MARAEHIEWLREGVSKWNQRRERDLFSPDFSSLHFGHIAFIDMSEADFSDANFQEANLSGVSLKGSNLKKANLIEAKLTGSDLSWADISEANLRGANLESANLRHTIMRDSELGSSKLNGASLDYADLKDAKLIGSELRDADLRNSDLRNANFTAANLDKASLYRADARNTKLNNAFLRESYLNRSDLRGADLSYAKCEGAKFEFANLEGANLIETKLFGADLQKVSLWKNTLYHEDRSPKKYYVTRLPKTSIKSIDDLLSVIRTIRELYDDHEESVSLYFRGEFSTNWELIPSVMRDPSFSRSEGESIIELISRRPEDFAHAESALAEWVIAQHYGLRTRFLDITRNPLVALFNSCFDNEEVLQMEDGRLHIFAVPRSLIKPFNSDTVSVIANFAKLTEYEQEVLLGNIQIAGESLLSNEHPETHMYPEIMLRLYQFIRQEKPYFRERINHRDFFRVFVVEPQQISERIRAQSGAFLISAFQKKLERVNVRSWNSRIPIYANYRLTVPKRCKQTIVNDLQLLNITRETLYPGLESTTEAISNRFQSSHVDFAA